MMRVVVTGAGGLIGRHARSRLHAANCAAAHRGEAKPWDIVTLGHAAFQNDAQLASALAGADAVLHFAGVNRAPEAEVETANPAISQRLVAACGAADCDAHIVHANSTHAGRDTAYGRSKARAADVLAEGVTRMTDLVLPHIFGEDARPFYNNVTATLIHQILDGTGPQLNPDGQVALLHAGAAADMAIDAIAKGQAGRITPEGRQMTVAALYERLRGFHDSYAANVIPDLSDPFDLQLFNTYRAAKVPAVRPLTRNTDSRGTLFEAVKGGGGGQTFLSTTKPGVTRGDHFHLDKVERFLVLGGEAVIRLRHVLSDEVQEIRVSGSEPVAIDMPTLTTHSIENIGPGELLTLFWSHALFDPAAPDTYADRVMP
ncbi:UDP-2-acetamido-2,6-beta-L-arabino-hexul-4-ose reductase [Palleronia marisminoris]|uniref:NAD dependent epimerase/dehydratase family protein n=1 Tax=Palleronia marisminoris TaxID=315423 RepID=A0A1Y5T012_9RHOB|nr:NAD-dependent epimerase/dehydratase family protein [Palleronia marisminoris]SFH05815.1 UDP-2-acetamido-2,6-beta-L-arabino-hexul-4-ose reductase [Palleronia marisminoris]SLN50927.1 NAD dependent epimerase/dehydratase family protein [Palleronia marisminoris]